MGAPHARRAATGGQLHPNPNPNPNGNPNRNPNPDQATNCSAFGPYFEPDSVELHTPSPSPSPSPPGAAAFACHHWWSRSPVGEYVPVVDGATLRTQVVEEQSQTNPDPDPKAQS